MTKKTFIKRICDKNFVLSKKIQKINFIKYYKLTEVYNYETSRSNLIERSQYNKRRRKLFFFLEEIRTKLASRFLEFEDYFIVDSMPLEICKFARHRRIEICKNEFETAPSKGFCASQNNWFYGCKLHGVCSINGIYHSLDITKAEVHDVHFLKNIKHQMSDCVLLGDRGCLSQSIQLD